MKIAVIRVRGIRKVKPKIAKTLELMRLNRPNHCVIVDDSRPSMGMLKTVNDYVAYGEIDEETLFKLLYRKGKKGSKKLSSIIEKDKIQAEAKEIIGGKKKVADVADPVFMLHPPRKGYKNAKKAYPLGALGKHDDINALLRRMM